jgi:hypothetical protein
MPQADEMKMARKLPPGQGDMECVFRVCDAAHRLSKLAGCSERLKLSNLGDSSMGGSAREGSWALDALSSSQSWTIKKKGAVFFIATTAPILASEGPIFGTNWPVVGLAIIRQLENTDGKSAQEAG